MGLKPSDLKHLKLPATFGRVRKRKSSAIDFQNVTFCRWTHEISGTIPYAPSANVYWRKFMNRMVLSPRAREYKKALALSGRKIAPFSCPVEIEMRMYRPQKSGDLDNRIKVVLDSLNGIAFADDSQVVKITAERFDDKDRPRIEVVVRPYMGGNAPPKPSDVFG